MNQELTYALITPYSLYKSRTGGILARLLANSKLDLVDMRMFIMSDGCVDRYAEAICPVDTDPAIVRAWRNYLEQNLRQSNAWHYVPRCMILLFRGPDAVRHMKEDVIGSFTEAPVGDTIRGTFGDLIRAENGSIRHFEPAVITCSCRQRVNDHLRIFADFSETDGGVLTHRIEYPDADNNIETTLVLIKPDDFQRRGRRTGNIIDTISRTGLRIVGSRVVPMTLDMGEQLYGRRKDEFVSSLQGDVAQTVYSRLHDAFAFPFTMYDAQRIGDMLAERNAAAEFNQIVEYMTGVNPDEAVESGVTGDTSRASCIALVYEGPDAVAKVRSVLSGIDPTRIVTGIGHSDFGRDLLQNGAHASESVEEAEAHRAIIGLGDAPDEASAFKRTIEERLQKLGRS